MLENGISKITINTEISSRVYVDIQGDEEGNSDTTSSKRKFGSDSNLFMVYGVKES